ncbi:hypothetical protein B0H67DRAFT_648448 [Lasiosphaeris hirsuta]|uniref:SPX domain-containing protein n=1 Tax=Lasiosphaeris hirsuta TaxID=260670 RepID=A0AA40A321_9PEZI|nr:hypothetical protein B0H67DRAFT_648448 [Lasiosphaeris hirsuta]
MKYGEQFERESVPQWSLHNLDYNSLKHHIKVHTTKDQAIAIAIPGYQDITLRKFEDELYTELCRQHDRVDLFVASKADEIARRLHYVSNQIHRLLLRCAVSRRDGMSLKRQRRFAKYEQDLLRCREDVRSLQRFVNAQVVAFRKILKKYRKWTGSSSLGSRFRDTILSHPKSFTKRDFSLLQAECDDLLATLRAASPADVSGLGSPATESSPPSIRRVEAVSPSETIVVQEPPPPPHAGYWNEYDCGSEADDAEQNSDSRYAIYINPDDAGFPGIAAIASFFTAPVRKVNEWMKVRSPSDLDHNNQAEADENGPLLPSLSISPYGTARVNADYFAQTLGAGAGSETEADDDLNQPSRRGSYGYESSNEEFPTGYKAHYAALPSVQAQSLALYRERVLFWGTWWCFLASYLLMGIAALLIMTGRHKLRLEVDAGVTLGIMTSLGAACAALGMSFSRQDVLGCGAKLAVWTAFMTVCVLNGILLVLVVGNAPLPLAGKLFGHGIQ